MQYILEYIGSQFTEFFNFVTTVRIPGGPTLYQIIVAFIFTGLTLTFLFMGPGGDGK